MNKLWDNFKKSSIFLGKGSGEGDREMINEIIGISSEALSDKYLGLQPVVGRSKEGTFKHVKESSKRKVLGCKGQGLSKAAK